MKIQIRPFVLFVSFCALLCVPLFESGCRTTPTLEPGGDYSHVDLYQIDSSIRASNETLKAFVAWEATPGVHRDGSRAAAIAADITAHRLEWISRAIAARDTFAAARNATTKGDLDAALQILTSIINQVAEARKTP